MDAQKKLCKQCSAKILSTTYEKTGGFCVPCFQYIDHEKKVYAKTNSIDQYEPSSIQTKFRNLKSNKCPNCRIRQEIELGKINLCINCGCRFEVNNSGNYRLIEKESKIISTILMTTCLGSVFYYFFLRQYIELPEKIESAVIPICLGGSLLLLVPYSFITKRVVGRAGQSFYRRRYPKMYIVALILYFIFGVAWLGIGVQELLK